jgi:NAD(P)-dependent dehydrogenase (short-subunit alcohol dehydrogenase family)
VSARVLITGAAGGIGVAATEELRRRGARVIGLDLHGDGDGVIACDVRDQAAVDGAVAEAIERLGGLDVLINNAGLGNPQSAGKPPDEAALAVLDVNLIGPWRVTSAAIDALRESRGRVVNVASGLAHLAVPLAPAYVMSKRGLVAYSDSLRYEHGDEITVTTIYPGYIRTAIHRASEEAGMGLDGVVPAEPVAGAARTLADAALGQRRRRDLATTHRGTFAYWLARVSPRPLVDSVVMGHLRRLARSGKIADGGLGAELVARLRGSRRRSAP